jgi:membrane protein DedA with SNARE-associated domain
MWEEILKAIPVALSASVKFIFGPLGGFAAGLSLATTVVATVAGTMLSVVAFTYFGDFLRKKVIVPLFGPRRRSEERAARYAVFLKKYGTPAVAGLTPLIFTPIGGTLIAVGMGIPKDKILISMLISATVWAVLFTTLIYFFGQEVLPDFVERR